jgi:transposase InsO family protein
VQDGLRVARKRVLRCWGWGWFYLSTILDHSRFIIAWKLCTTMRAEDVTETLDLALAASGCEGGRGERILANRALIKAQTIRNRRLLHQVQAA